MGVTDQGNVLTCYLKFLTHGVFGAIVVLSPGTTHGITASKKTFMPHLSKQYQRPSIFYKIQFAP